MAGDADLSGPRHPTRVGDLTGGAQFGTEVLGALPHEREVFGVHAHPDADHDIGIGEQVGVVVPPALEHTDLASDVAVEVFDLDPAGPTWLRERKDAGSHRRHLDR